MARHSLAQARQARAHSRQCSNECSSQAAAQASQISAHTVRSSCRCLVPRLSSWAVAVQMATHSMFSWMQCFIRSGWASLRQAEAHSLQKTMHSRQASMQDRLSEVFIASGFEFSHKLMESNQRHAAYSHSLPFVPKKSLLRKRQGFRINGWFNRLRFNIHHSVFFIFSTTLQSNHSAFSHNQRCVLFQPLTARFSRFR